MITGNDDLIITLSPDASLNLSRPPYFEEGLGVAILGNKGSGKSNALALFAEEGHRQQLPFIFFDPNGDAASLRTLGPDVMVIGYPDDSETMRRAHYPLSVARRDPGQFVEMVLREGYSLVVDLREGEDPDERHDVFQRMVNAHFKLSTKLRTPCLVMIDEAAVFAPQSGADKLEKASLKAVGRIASDGRKRGMLQVIATQRSAYLHKSVIYGANVRLFGKTVWADDFDKIRSYLPPAFNHPFHGFAKMKKFQSGQFIIVSDNAWGETRIHRRQTPDLGKTPVMKAARKPRPSVEQLTLFTEA